MIRIHKNAFDILWNLSEVTMKMWTVKNIISIAIIPQAESERVAVNNKPTPQIISVTPLNKTINL
jgi:hypothetical protein